MESRISNSCHAVGNRNGCQTAAIIESPLSNTRHTVRSTLIRYGIRNIGISKTDIIGLGIIHLICYFHGIRLVGEDFVTKVSHFEIIGKDNASACYKEQY